MTSRQWNQIRRIVALLLALLVLIQPAGAVEVVVNSDVTATHLTSLELRAIFTMRLRTWPDGLPIRVFVLSDSAPAQAEFSKKILDMFPYQLRRYWDRLVFSGTGQAPTELNSAEEMRDRVASTPGAIGYLPENLVDNRIRVVKVGTP
jgi:ABC-type phosphate transport system substrate-binding protein